MSKDNHAQGSQTPEDILNKYGNGHYVHKFEAEKAMEEYSQQQLRRSQEENERLTNDNNYLITELDINGKKRIELQEENAALRKLKEPEPERKQEREETLLNDIDELLSRLEDFTHGSDGDAITKMRGRIIEYASSISKDSQGRAETESEAIDFADWLVKSGYMSERLINSTTDSVRWLKHYSHPSTREFFTSKELFDEYNKRIQDGTNA